MRMFLPNSANLQNITAILAGLDSSDPEVFQFSMHPRWVAVHPVVLAMTACLATKVRASGGRVVGSASEIPTLPYLIRMKLFDYLGIDPGRQITPHAEEGRFIPLTQIRTPDDLRQSITNLIPLLHAPEAVAAPIKYVFSEVVRNALEHSASPVGAFVCAQYYKKTKRVAIGIADAGIGVYHSMVRHHPVTDSASALQLALQPGVTGTTPRRGGNQFNAGAGLFFTKSIAVLSRNRFLIYTGNSMFRLMKTRQRNEPLLHADPNYDPHTFVPAPHWDGTIVGLDLNVEQGIDFGDLLDVIRTAYRIDVRRQKDYTAKIKFS